MNVSARILTSITKLVVLTMMLASVASGQQTSAQQPPSSDGFPAGPRARILSFTASPSSIASGQSVTLEWTVINADRITLDQGIGIVATRDGRTVKPTATTTYTLTALGYRARTMIRDR